MYNCLPEDETKGFETYRRQQKLELKINLENCIFRWFALYNYITMHGAKHTHIFYIYIYIDTFESKLLHQCYTKVNIFQSSNA